MFIFSAKNRRNSKLTKRHITKNYRIIGIVGDKLFLKSARTDSGA